MSKWDLHFVNIGMTRTKVCGIIMPACSELNLTRYSNDLKLVVLFFGAMPMTVASKDH